MTFEVTKIDEKWIESVQFVCSKLPKLKFLNTSSNSLPITLQEAILLQSASPGSSWKILHLAGSIRDLDKLLAGRIKEGSEALIIGPSDEIISIHGYVLPTIEQFLKENPKIEMIHIENLVLFEHNVWQAICSLSELRFLNIECKEIPRLNSSDFHQITSRCPKLEQVQILDLHEQILFHIHLKPKSMILKESYFHSTLNPLELEVHLQKWTQISQIDAKDYDLTDDHLSMIAQHCLNLKALSLDRNLTIQIAALKSLLKNCSQLEYLSLNGCTQFSDDELKNLFSTPHSLKFLYLKNLSFSLETLEFIIKSNPLIEYLAQNNSFNTDYITTLQIKYFNRFSLIQ